MRWGDDTGAGAWRQQFGLEELRNFIGPAFSGADLDEESGEGAGHFVEEAVALDDEGDFRSVLPDIAAAEGADGVLEFAGAGDGEGEEIVGAGEVDGGFAHGGEVELCRNVPGAVAVQRVHRGVIPEGVVVGFPGGVEAGVETGRDGFSVDHADIVRQEMVERGGKPVGANGGGIDLEVRGHGVGVDAGIGAARGFEADFFPEDLVKGALDLILNGAAAGLGLPAVISGAVVSDVEQDFQWARFGVRDRVESSMRLRVKATPNARKSEVTGWEEDPTAGRVLRVRIAAPPVEGKANAELEKFLAKWLGVAKSEVRLEKGGTSRIKTFEVPEGVAEQLERER